MRAAPRQSAFSNVYTGSVISALCVRRASTSLIEDRVSQENKCGSRCDSAKSDIFPKGAIPADPDSSDRDWMIGVRAIRAGRKYVNGIDEGARESRPAPESRT